MQLSTVANANSNSSGVELDISMSANGKVLTITPVRSFGGIFLMVSRRKPTNDLLLLRVRLIPTKRRNPKKSRDSSQRKKKEN
jgi:hypothetical protein